MLKKIVSLILVLLMPVTVSACSVHKGPNGNGGSGNNGNYDYELPIYPKLAKIHIANNDDEYFKPRYTPVEMSWNGEWYYVDSTISVTSCDEAERLFEIPADVKVRGNYTTIYDKKPFRIKFKEARNLLGLHDGKAYKDWILLAEWKDTSMLRNSIAFYLSKLILGSDGYYSSDFRPVELYINGDYRGIYTLCEQQEVKEGRIDINDPKKDYTGLDIGYYYELDSYYDKEDPLNYFAIDYYRGNGEIFNTTGYAIKSDIYSEEQRDFLQNYTEKLYEICYRAVHNDEYLTFDENYENLVPADTDNSYDTISKVIDVQSVIDSYLVQEIACDFDIGWSSYLMDVDMSAEGDKILRFEAAWDFDSAFGLKCVPDGKGLFALNSGQSQLPPNADMPWDFNNPWISVFSTELWFRRMAKEKWMELMDADVLPGCFEYIDYMTQTFADNYTHNFDRWGTFDTSTEVYQFIKEFTEHRQASEYFYNWLYNRLSYLQEFYGDGTEFYPELKKGDL